MVIVLYTMEVVKRRGN